MSHLKRDTAIVLGPIVPGLCNALLHKRGVHNIPRCRQKPRDGEARCVVHRNYVEPMEIA